MYLELLSKSEQEDFLELAKYSMSINGQEKKEEENIFLSYKYECQLVDYKITKQDKIDTIILNFNNSTKKIKKIVLIELLGIFHADGEVCEKETNFLLNLSNSFNIEVYELNRIKRWVEAMNDIVQEGYELISK
ncbi:hypothetical protein PT520_11365 [Aliarcobacter butzleri]|uniref:Co-chaperone DjlA N-terminal domain-containing protein n=1 Tax=Aliarcobacter butzleri TaxID=28197 RepID=A0AAW6VTF6_9BACT|nr:hypothetical protein [Aliarcobacter butzleri]MDK2063114.1 hypothetical protein [Aliarcobacter butzleri]